MSVLRSNTARLLLDRVALDSRAQVVQDVATSLNANSGSADIGFAAALLELHPDAKARTALLDHLCALVERGESSQVVLACSDRPDLSSAVLATVIESVSGAAALLGDPQTKDIAQDLDTRRVSTSEEQLQSLDGSQKTAKSLLFLGKALTPKVISEHLDRLVGASLRFVGQSDRTLANASRDVLFAVFSLPREACELSLEPIWDTIEELVGSKDVFRQTLGFSIWLRLIISRPDDFRQLQRHQPYWDYVEEGLRYGDSERRKACLQILRGSVDIAAQDEGLLPSILADSHTTATPEAARKQYIRFCTIFETIVLGRYLNQVQECEADLDFLSSHESVVKPVWLYTLLSSALEHKMQDANRKFVGRWILRSRIRTDDPDAYLRFFRHALLPWATGGNLFTSTLKRTGGSLRSEHGEILSNYILTLLQEQAQLSSGVIDAILDSILSRHGNNFAYAMAYLIEGIGKAYEAKPDLAITPQQLESIGKIPTWAGLPEVARDLIISISWKMSHTYIRRNSADPPQEVATFANNWEKLQQKVNTLGPNASAHIDGNIASLALDKSKRDKFEESTIQKCISLQQQLEGSQNLDDQAKLVETIDDIWSDLEYLEYPKSLLAVLPRIIPHQHLVELALKQEDEDVNLANTLASKTLDLLELSKSRSYLLSPLAISIRQVALASPGAGELLRLEDFLVGLAEQPPIPTIDAQLEDAVVPLLKSLDPSLAPLDYEFYFGPREGQGFAALLDIVSRLGAMNTNLHKVILDRLLERWLRQKAPPPTVSPWKTTLQLQIMLICSDQYLVTASAEEATKLIKDLYYMLAIEPLPRYRYLFEWMIARAYIHHPAFRSDIFAELRTKDHHSNPKFLASLMKLGVTIAKTEGSDEHFAKELSNVFVPLAASSKVVIRHEAQWQVPVLMDHARLKGWTSISGDKAFVELDEFIRSLSVFDDPPLERQIDKLDPVNDHNLTHLVRGPWYHLDNVEASQTSHEDFLALYARDSTTLPESCIPLGPPIPTPPQTQAPEPINQDLKIAQNIDNISRALGSGPSPIALQTKGAAYLSSAPTRHNNLLVIASLVDNPYNLGGLSRVSEIFGAGALYLQNTHVTSNKDFTNVSVSSHMHLPILPLSASGVPEFIAQKKREEGYNVVGIEQTDRSVLVGSEGCVLPEKCLLVMGSEREGIPAVILGECDLLVEIPQVGITRSLNVQTAAAIVLCEYAKQWKKN